MSAAKIWIDQCDASRNLKKHFGAEQAMSYLIGEKLLAHLEAAETDDQFQQELQPFVAEIRNIFEPQELSDFFNTPRKLGPMGHAMSTDDFAAFQESEQAKEQAPTTSRHQAFEKARALLFGETT